MYNHQLLPFSNLNSIPRIPSNFIKEFIFKSIWTVHEMAKNLAMKIYKVLGRTMCGEIIAQNRARALSGILFRKFKPQFSLFTQVKPSSKWLNHNENTQDQHGQCLHIILRYTTRVHCNTCTLRALKIPQGQHISSIYTSSQALSSIRPTMSPVFVYKYLSFL